ncbi:MAG: hypothetical protein KKF44_11660 [Nanoarchaeota archaeon]|nr:hypothetical protein [Nanoarchaeota archaeon]
MGIELAEFTVNTGVETGVFGIDGIGEGDDTTGNGVVDSAGGAIGSPHETITIININIAKVFLKNIIFNHMKYFA